YANQDEVGTGRREAFVTGVRREDIVVTRVWAAHNTRVKAEQESWDWITLIRRLRQRKGWVILHGTGVLHL
ncbi:hypothetical protein C8R45DRAFT_831459, partial [Mycena sanguinolenta]